MKVPHGAVTPRSGLAGSGRWAAAAAAAGRPWDAAEDLVLATIAEAAAAAGRTPGTAWQASSDALAAGLAAASAPAALASFAQVPRPSLLTQHAR